MNITRLTVIEAVNLLKSPEISRHYEQCGTRFAGTATGTIDLFKYAAWLVDGKPRPIGRQKTYTSEEQKAKKRAADLERIHEETKTANEIGEIPFKTINWERRLACKNDQMLFEKTYLPTICEKPNADYHIILAERIAETIQNGGRQAILLPRGGGKTMKCRSGAAHGILYGRIRWGYNLSANEQQAKETMETLKTWFSKNPILLEDFPEICFPLSILGTKHTGSVVRSQTFQGVKTNVVWGNEEFRCPSLILPEDVALWYQEHDPESVKKIILDPSQPENYFWIPTSSYAIFSSQGIQSGIRGGNVTHPQTLASIRPNFVILDDIQNDQTAASMVSVSKLEGIINNAVSYLAKPGEPIALLMPCTVIESDDLADTYGDPDKKPEWRGIRVPMITQWPKGMDNVVISQETETAKLWLEYAEIRRKSLRKHGDIRDATEFYKTHQTLMDEGFTVSWDARFYPNEVSAIQHAMNLRFSNHQSFLSNMQQVGKNVLTATEQKIRWSDFCEKMADYDKGTVPADTQRLVAYIDIQAEYFAYVVLAVSFDLSCCFIADYGTFPDFKMANYRRRQANSWRLLTKSYMAARMLPGSREKLNIDDVYTWGLRSLLDDLFARPYIRADENNTILHIHHIALDAQEGIIAPIVRDVCQKYPPEKTIAYHGFGLSAGRMGMETYSRQGDTIFEDIRNPVANACRWMYKFSDVSGAYELHSDVNAWKDYLFERLRTPIGEKGSMVLYSAPTFAHELFAVQVCESERSEEFVSRGVTRNRWVTTPGADNEYLDCLVGCCCLASFAGCVYVPTGGIKPPEHRLVKRKKSFRERLKERRERVR